MASANRVYGKRVRSSAKTVEVAVVSDLKKIETVIQTEKNDNDEQKTKTDKVMNLLLLTVCENKLRSIIRGSFERIKQSSMPSREVQTEAEIKQLQDLKIEPIHDIDLLRTIGAGFLGAAGLSLVRQVKLQGIKNFSKAVYDSWQQKGKFRLILKRKDIFIGGGSAAIGYALYSKFPLFFNRKKGNKDNNFQMKEN